ncbi:hypothetical protein [Schleiferilactobacillus harbinensis]|uniref:hypothetical protein n=1 Tax=Schleiferilactobacillus harbinensis TaxID=304207 RepID=UPI0039EA2CE8
MMMAKGLHYSLAVLVYLELARQAIEAAKLDTLRIEPDVEIQFAAAMQYDALKIAKQEAQRGPQLESLVSALPPEQAAFLQTVCDRWRRYLAVVGYQLPPIDFKTKK